MPPLRPLPPPSSLLRPLHHSIRTFTSTPTRPLAKISVLGRLAADPELVPTSSGQDLIRYAIGTQSGPKDNRQTSWWKVAAFANEGPQKDILLRLGKGSLLYVEGSCVMAKYTDKEGNERSAMNITQRHFEILDRRNADGSDSGNGEPSEPDA
ncbi:MAG: hypothetical protein Q9186_000334 [Xanthomendoza sp. 1 TL-2023]